jgi:uncharacterized protein involved in exopolysaccharide biosynthesis
MKELDLSLIWNRALHGWKTPALLAAIGIMYTISTFPLAQPVYRVQMTVTPAPAQQTSAATSGGGGLSMLLGLAAGGGSTDYARYQDTLTSTAVADRLAKKYNMLKIVFAGEWDAKNNRWVPPKPTLVSTVKGWFIRLANIRPWNPPDATALAAYLKGHLLITPSTLTDITVIEMESPNPQLAVKLMLAAHTEANQVLSDQVAARAREQVRYLEGKLATTSVSDYRATLLALLSQQEKTVMLTQTNTSYAADILSPPIVWPTPVSPRPVLSLFVAALVGTLIGLLITIFFGADWWRTPASRLRQMLSALRAGRYSEALAALRG